MVRDVPADSKPSGTGTQIVLPECISGREALFVLTALARVKNSGFGRLVINVSDGRIVEIELVEKVDRKVVKTLSDLG